MTSYSARYERGEHDEVWSELRELGSAALRAPIREDAEAVARAMALRARHNIELLVERLTGAGYDFHSNNDDRSVRPAHTPPTAEAAGLVDWLEEQAGPVPLTVAAWIREVGDVWLVGDHPQWPTSELADPLVVEFEHSAYTDHDVRDYYADELQVWRENQDDDAAARPFEIVFAPDDLHKANISGGAPYGVLLPAVAADALVATPHVYFVDYLNSAFAAGGFPGGLVTEGFEQPPAGLRENLARDLLRL
ncbi:hypothetical protein [Myceligenerans indicum]|uniref:Uncharacterized protein n=1 Tax=Myceligenerans indicum TaxID=2593663 RepID=A0ABS1LJL0_9MICO|nr:hypothetical protein [Myceligenerans indicum]MBL0886358.1 hypothetical protein [Myceligenerans indicum]